MTPRSVTRLSSLRGLRNRRIASKSGRIRLSGAFLPFNGIYKIRRRRCRFFGSLGDFEASHNRTFGSRREVDESFLDAP